MQLHFWSLCKVKRMLVDMPSTNFPPMRIEKDSGYASRSSCSNCSSSNLGFSSSDSDSRISSRSDSDVVKAYSLGARMKSIRCKWPMKKCWPHGTPELWRDAIENGEHRLAIDKHHENKEKANEISISAEKDFSIEKF
eukprot:Gb_07790 [translate_table: standard]